MHEVFHVTDNGYGIITVRDGSNKKVDDFSYAKNADGTTSVFRDPFGPEVWRVPAEKSVVKFVENMKYVDAGLL